MTSKRTLSILQYNVQESRTVMAPLLRKPAVLELVSLPQEPWRNPRHNTTHNPAADHSHLVYMDSQNTGTCFFVNKQISKAGKNHLPDVCSLRFKTNTIRLKAYEVTARLLNNTPSEEHIVLGDFNARYYGREGKNTT